MRLLLAILLLLAASPAMAQQGQGMSQAVVVNSCGGGALPSGALNQLTMDTTGRLCQIGVGASTCPQAATYLARTVGGNEGGNAANIATLICGLVGDGVWNNLDLFYVLAQQNQTDANLNLISTSYTLTGTSFGVFTAYQGYHDWFGGTTDTGFNAASAPSPHVQLNNGSVSAWLYTNHADGIQLASSAAGPGGIYIGPQFFGVNFCGIGPAGALNIPQNTSPGFFACDMPSSSGTNYYFNGASAGFVAGAAAGAFDGLNLAIGGNAAGLQQTSSTISEVTVGSSLGAAGNLALYNRLRTYMTAVGVP